MNHTHTPHYTHTRRYRNNKDVYIHGLVYVYAFPGSVGGRRSSDTPLVRRTHSA